MCSNMISQNYTASSFETHQRLQWCGHVMWCHRYPWVIPAETCTREHGYGFSAGVGVGTGRVTHGLLVLCTMLDPLSACTVLACYVALYLTCIYWFRTYFLYPLPCILAHTCRRILILSSSDPLLGMFIFRLVLHNNLNTVGSPASTAFRSASRPTAVALTPSGYASVHKFDLMDWSSLFFKTYYEKWSIRYLFINFDRIFVIHMAPMIWFATEDSLPWLL